MESGRHRERVSLLGRGASSFWHDIGHASKGLRVGSTYASGSSRDSYANGAVNPNVSDSHRDYRRKRARRAALRYVVVWSTVAALALIAQVIAPAAAT